MFIGFFFCGIVASPRIAAFLQKKGLSPLPTDAINYTTNIVNQVLARRRQHLERRNDFIQIMVDHEQEVQDTEETDKQEQLSSGTLKKSMKTYCWNLN